MSLAWRGENARCVVHGNRENNVNAKFWEENDLMVNNKKIIREKDVSPDVGIDRMQWSLQCSQCWNRRISSHQWHELPLSARSVSFRSKSVHPFLPFRTDCRPRKDYDESHIISARLIQRVTVTTISFSFVTEIFFDRLEWERWISNAVACGTRNPWTHRSVRQSNGQFTVERRR